MGTRPHTTPGTEGRSLPKTGILERLFSLVGALTLPTISRHQARAAFLAFLMLASVVGMGFAPGAIGTATAEEDTEETTLAADGSTIKLIDADGTVVDEIETGIDGIDEITRTADGGEAYAATADGLYNVDLDTEDVTTVSTEAYYDVATDGDGNAVVANDGTVAAYSSGGSQLAETTHDADDIGDSVAYNDKHDRILVGGDRLVSYAWDGDTITEDYVDTNYDARNAMGGIATDGDHAYYASGDGFVQVWIDGNDMSTEVTPGFNDMTASGPVQIDGDKLYVTGEATMSDTEAYLAKVDVVGDGEVEWEAEAPVSHSDPSGVTIVDGDERTIQYDTSGEVIAVNEDSMGGLASVDTTGTTATALETGWASAAEDTDPDVEGQVVTDDGAPVPGATVEVWSVDHNELEEDPEIEDVEAEADRLMEKASDPLPDEWEEQDGVEYDVLGDYEELDDEPVPLIHLQSAWTDEPKSAWVVGYGGLSLDDPALQLHPQERYEISVWVPGKSSSGDGVGFSDPFDAQLDGATDDGHTVTIDRIGPGGDVVDHQAVTTTENYVSENRWGSEQKRHETATIAGLEPGVYEIGTVEGDFSYHVVVGDPDEIAETFEADLEDDADELTERAEWLRDQMDTGTFERQTITADSNGEFTVDVPDNHETIGVKAYKGADAVMDTADIEDGVTLDEIRTAYEEEEYRGSVYLSLEPERVSPPDDGVEVVVHEVGSPGYEDLDLDELMDRFDWLEDLINDGHYEELASIFDNPSEILDQDELDTRYDATVIGLIEGTELEPVFVEIAEENGVETEITNEHDDTTKAQQIAIAEQVLAGAEPESDPVDDSDVEIDHDDETGDTTVTIPVDDADEFDEFEVIVTDDDGVSVVVDDEQVDVDESMLGDDEVNVELDLDDEDIAQIIEVIGVDEDGDVTREETRVTNPSFGGDVPAVDSINVNTQRPGVGDVVTADVTPSDGGHASVEDVTVYAPDGDEVDASVDDGEVQFEAEAEGTHTMQFEIASETGDSVVESVRVEAVDERVDMPAAVRVTSGVVGEYGVASDGVDSAWVDSTAGGSKVSVTAQVDDGVVPGHELRVYGIESPYSLQQYTVRVVDSDRSVIGDDVSVSVHTSSLHEDSHIRVDGDAVPVGESGPGGEAESRGNGVVVHTVAGNGVVEVSVDNDPGLLDRVMWWVETSVPLVPVNAPAFPAVLSTAVVESAVTAFSTDFAVTEGITHA